MESVKKTNVLIVEDSFIVSFHLEKILSDDRFNIVGIEESGESALRLLKSKRADIVLMDIMLDGQMDGIETARVIRSLYNLPVIFISALTDNATIQRAKVTEPFGYITKPFNEREILRTLEMALHKHSIELKLRESEEKYLSTVRSMSDALVLVDVNCKVVYMNPKAEGLVGMAMREAEGKQVSEVLAIRNPYSGESINPLQSALSDHSRCEPINEKMLVSFKGGECLIGEASLSAYTDSAGNCKGVILIFRDISEKAAHQRLVKEFETKRLLALFQGQDEERMRVSKDLHDGLGQILTAIKMNLIFENPPDIGKLVSLIEEAILESVRISENLVPAKLKDFTLSTCLRTLCSQISGTNRSTVRFESLGDEREVSQANKVNLFRIAQEAINNSIKHSKAENIIVQLNDENGRIQLTIEDDGRGFDNSVTRDPTQHHGLNNMRERAEIIGGKFEIETDLERGTLIIVEIPTN